MDAQATPVENFNGPLGLQDKEGIEALIQETCEKADMQEAYADITWEFSSRLRTTLGLASWNQYSSGYWKVFHIKLCFVLWGRATYEQRQDVIIHETVHLLATRKHGYDVGHNHLWKAMMVQCGGNPNRCHDVSVKGVLRTQKKYLVDCRCTRHLITRNFLTRMEKGHHRTCTKCKYDLNPDTAELQDWWLYEDES